MSDDDSPWMDDEPYAAHDGAAAPPSLISQQEWDKLSTRFSDAGYRDGITQGKNERLQAGFDQGFVLAAPYARELGSLRGTAASLLALLTVPSATAKKHSAALVDAALASAGGPPAADRIVAELRDIVTVLGRLDAVKVMPVDEEAEAHAREHADEGISEVLRERRETRAVEDMMSGLGGGGGGAEDEARGKGGETAGEAQVAECRRRLGEVLRVFGLDGALPPTRS
ncbi:hypothetical protein JCM9279_001921 [Rhodotorula babjevae]